MRTIGTTCLALLLTVPAVRAATSDTVFLDLARAESLLSANSSEWLAKRSAAEADRGTAEQAALWDNPNLSVTQGAYNGRTGKWFDVTGKSETAVQLQQAIALAGKRAHRLEVAEGEARLSAMEARQIRRDLIHALRLDFSGLHYLRAYQAVHNREIATLRILVDGFSKEYKRGNVSLIELSRLQAMLFGLEEDGRALAADIRGRQASLGYSLMLPAGTEVAPQPDTLAWEGFSSAGHALAEILDSAFSDREEMRAHKAKVAVAAAGLELERAQRIPDVTLGAGWDRAGSYIPDYNAVSLSLDIPIWNRNQGGIHAAQARLEAARHEADGAPLRISGEVRQAYAEMQAADSLYRAWKDPFTLSFDALAESIYRSYAKRSLSMLDFVDFFQSYDDSKSRLFKLQNGRIDAYENLNYASGRDWYKID